MNCDYCGFYCCDNTREDCPRCGTYYEIDCYLRGRFRLRLGNRCMNATQAAREIGISHGQVCWLIRAGKLKARKVRSGENQHGKYSEYEITEREVQRVKALGNGRGRPRGPTKRSE